MIRAIQPGDWPAIDRIQHASFPSSAIETVETLCSIASVAPEMCAVAEAKGEVIGYLLAHPWLPDDLPLLNEPLDGFPAEASCVFLHDLAFSPAARGTGLASEMVNRLFATAAETGLTSSSLLSVQGTVEFWARFGFVARPELTERFRKRVFGFYEIDFHFMTASLI